MPGEWEKKRKRVAVIGAVGFLGQGILQTLASRNDIGPIVAIDRHPGSPRDGVVWHQGDFSDPRLQEAALDRVDVVIHLAAVLGGAAEADPVSARRVNVDQTLDLIDRLKGRGVRFVFASTIAAYGGDLPDPVRDTTPRRPSLLYGAHKVMIEVALSQMARRGWLDAVSLRPAGIMARDGADATLKSAFMSRLFHAVRRGEDITLPVAADGTTWLASVENVARNFMHAATLADLGQERAFTLTSLRISYGALVEALRRRYPDSPSRISFEPDPEAMALFGTAPGLVTETADRLGFTRDKDADALVRGAMEEDRT